MIFKNGAHGDFFLAEASELNAGCCLKALIYTLGICDGTRSRFGEIYDKGKGEIIPRAIDAAWQTSTSLKATRLAFNLYTGFTPTTLLRCGDDADAIKESRKYSVCDIFRCGLAPYFAEAIRIRYPEYLR